ncbi:MAG: hypothetical protein AB7U20_19795 [Planctomycetaceae bacterium]
MFAIRLVKPFPAFSGHSGAAAQWWGTSDQSRARQEAAVLVCGNREAGFSSETPRRRTCPGGRTCAEIRAYPVGCFCEAVLAILIVFAASRICYHGVIQHR